MNGHLLKEAPICVDCFTGPYNSQKYLHFLSHVHADHIVGLTREFKHKVFCTEISARLIRHKLDITSDIIVELEELVPHVFNNNEFYFTVTLIPANHCPGSVMFLFELNSEKVLYTGDFRYCQELSKTGSSFWGSSVGIVNSLYLDNTYCDPVCCFTSRKYAIKQVINICKENEGKRIYIGISWTGHENLLVEIAKEMNENIVVSNAQYQVLKLLQMPNVFVTDKNQGRIFAVSMHMLTSAFLTKARKHNENVIAIKPTARLCNVKFVNKDGLYYVNYSNHSSYVELLDFVKEVRPQIIYPIVQGKNCIDGIHRADMSVFDSLLNTDSPSPICQSIKQFSPLKELIGTFKPNRKQKLKQSNKRRKPIGVVFE